MAQLTFTEQTASNGTCWEATAVVNADFNLHIEREAAEFITVGASTVQNGMYQTAFVKNEGKAFDHDFNAIVYPKYIKVTSWSKPVAGKCFITEAD